MRNLIIGAILALALVACTAAATVYVSQEDHDADVLDLQRLIGALEYRVWLLEGQPPLYTFDNGGPR